MGILSVARTVIFYLFSKVIMIKLVGEAILSVMNISIEVEETAKVCKRLSDFSLVPVPFEAVFLDYV